MEVRQARPEDREAIFDLYRFAYPDWEKRIPDRWLWQFVDNPYADPENPSIFLALDEEGRIAGQTCSIMESLHIDGVDYPCGWVVDVFVRPEYRGQGVAKALKKVQKGQTDMVEMSISMVDAMRHIVQNMGSEPLDSLQVYLLRDNPRALSDAAVRRIGGGFLGFLLSKSRLVELYGLLLNAILDQKAKGRRQQTQDMQFLPVDTWGADADMLWASLQKEVSPAATRDAQYLNWKYNRQPGVDYHSFMAYRDEIPVGYLILRAQKSRGIVVDLLFSPHDEKGMLAALDFAVSYFQKKGLRDVRIGGTHPALLSCIRKVGYKRSVQTMAPMFYTTRDLDRAQLVASPWWITLGDHDQQQ